MKRKLINSFLILSGSTLISKIFSILNRILLSRLLHEQGMALYILVVPTLSLCITLAQFSVPSAVFRLVSNPRYQNKQVILSGLMICFLTCIMIILSLFCFSYTISYQLLKNKDAYLPILSIIPFVPLVALSGIIKNYYLGKEDVFSLSLAQFIEEVVRIIVTYFLITFFKESSLSILVSFAFLSMSAGEFCSICYLYFKHPRPILPNILVPYNKDNFILKDMMHIALPLTGSRLLHVFYNFIEPMILIHFLTRLSLSETYIQQEYAIINGYVISLLLTPTFFNNVILRLLVPIFNKDIAYHQNKALQKHILLGLLSSLCISIPFTLLFYFYGDYCLLIMYNTKKGYAYLKYMSIPFTLFYLQTPLSAALQCLNKNRVMFILSVIEILIELIFLFILIPIYHVASVAIVVLLGLLSTLLSSFYFVYKYVFSMQ